jgi:hypothetical protein
MTDITSTASTTSTTSTASTTSTTSTISKLESLTISPSKEVYRKRLIAKQLKTIPDGKTTGIYLLQSDFINTFYVMYRLDEICKLKELDLKEFSSAEIIIEFTIPYKFPKIAIDGKVLTPNGVIMPDEKYCLSFGNYHKDEQSITKNNINKHISQTMDCIMNWRDTRTGIGLIFGTMSESEQSTLIKDLSSKSHLWNVSKLATLYKEFKDTFNFKD